jgi:release factor glutamine methyltransferase
MITVLESIKLSTKFLTEKGIESPRANAEILLADILNCKRLDLYLLFDRPLTELELQCYRDYLKSRSKFTPLQYILGKVDFYGLELNVNKSVLIPRPETELLVENIIKQFSDKNNQSILDIGFGSGNICIALAVNLEPVKLIATDINDEALKIAIQNAEHHNVSDKINFVKHDILNEDLNSFQNFDIIVSNPPYVSKESFPSLQKEITDFEPRSAVTDEHDGYTFFRVIAEKASKKLNDKGKLYFEIAEGQRNEVVQILGENNFANIEVIKDYQRIDRIICGEIK